MTPPQLLGQATKAGFTVYLRPDGTPAWKAARTGAVMPERLAQKIRANRDAIIGWLQSAVRAAPWDSCRAMLKQISPNVSELVCGCCEGRTACAYPNQLCPQPEGSLP